MRQNPITIMSKQLLKIYFFYLFINILLLILSVVIHYHVKDYLYHNSLRLIATLLTSIIIMTLIRKLKSKANYTPTTIKTFLISLSQFYLIGFCLKPIVNFYYELNIYQYNSWRFAFFFFGVFPIISLFFALVLNQKVDTNSEIIDDN